MGVNRLGFAALLLVAACPIQAQFAQHGVWVPGFQEQMPRYWTGTLNLARGSAISEGGWIEEAWLYVKEAGGDWTEVNHWVDDPGEGGPMGIGLEAVFDSTHFDHSDVVFVRLVVTDVVYGTTPTTKESNYGFAAVHNRSIAYNHHDYLPYGTAGDGANPASTVLATMNFEPTTRSADGWTWETVKADSNDASVLYFNTHGTFDEQALIPILFTDASAGGFNAFNSDDVLVWREEINGTGLPPLNSTGKPTTMFVLLDACKAGTSGPMGTGGKFTTWFWPYDTSYFPTPPPYGVIDQALYGYTGLTRWSETATLADEYWPVFQVYHTVLEMRVLLLNACHMYADQFPGFIYIHFTPPGEDERSLWSPSDCPIWGDWYTRLSGVYTGNNSLAPQLWHRPL